jgi:hypothetical protein
MKHWTVPSGGSSGPARKPVLWLRRESMNIMKNPALSGKKNPKRLGSGDLNNEKTMLGMRQAFFILGTRLLGLYKA